DLNPSYQSPEETNHTTVEAIRSLAIPGSQGYVPLASIAEITYEPAESVIRHEDGTRIASVQSDVAAGANPIQIAQTLQQELKKEPLPPGVTINVGGETEDVNRSFAEMGIAFLAGIALMLAILVLEFNSFR